MRDVVLVPVLSRTIHGENGINNLIGRPASVKIDLLGDPGERCDGEIVLLYWRNHRLANHQQLSLSTG